VCKFCIVPLHIGSWFKKYDFDRNHQTVYMQFLQSWVQEFNQYIQILRKNIMRG